MGSIIVEVGNHLASPSSVFRVHTHNIYQITVTFPPRQPSSSQSSRFSFSINTTSAYLTPSSKYSSKCSHTVVSETQNLLQLSTKVIVRE